MAFNYKTTGAIKISQSIEHVKVPNYSGAGCRDTYIGQNGGGNTVYNDPGTRGMQLISSKALGNGQLYVGRDQCGPRKDIFPVNG
jgi:hypothetical protein